MPTRIKYNPMGQVNGVLCIMRAYDLGLTAGNFALGGGTLDINGIKTPVPCQVKLFLTLSAGSVQVDVDKNATGTYAASEKTKNITVLNDQEVVAFASDASNPYVNFRLAGTGATITALEVQISGMVPETQDWHSIRSCFNALVNTVNTGIYTATSAD